MMEGKEKGRSVGGVALIDFVFLLGAIALLLVLLFPREAVLERPGESETVGAEGAAARP